jgi:hypothetical protein
MTPTKSQSPEAEGPLTVEEIDELEHIAEVDDVIEISASLLKRIIRAARTPYDVRMELETLRKLLPHLKNELTEARKQWESAKLDQRELEEWRIGKRRFKPTRVVLDKRDAALKAYDVPEPSPELVTCSYCGTMYQRGRYTSCPSVHCPNVHATIDPSTKSMVAMVEAKRPRPKVMPDPPRGPIPADFYAPVPLPLSDVMDSVAALRSALNVHMPKVKVPAQPLAKLRDDFFDTLKKRGQR